MEQSLAIQNPDSGSILSNTSSLTFDTRGNDRLNTILFRKIEEMERKLHDLETKKIIDETQLPPDVLENNGLISSRPKKLKRGSGYRPLLQGEIEEAKLHGKSAAAQARWLGVAKCTYRKYATLYGIYEPHPNEKGKKRNYDPSRGKYPLNRILTGEFNGNPAISDWIVKKKLIQSGTFLPKCNICGYDKHRILDNKICLLLDHRDGDTTNFKLDNLQLLCFNCTFECGRGYIRRGKSAFDPDWMQGADKDQIINSPIS